MKLAEEFVQKVTGAFGAVGQDWLNTLLERVDRICNKWNLHTLTPVPNLSYNYVLKGLDGHECPIILKLGLHGFDFQNEARTLETYNGAGCCRLLRFDDGEGAMLLEQLDPGSMLSRLDDEEAVIEHFVHVWRLIRRPTQSASHRVPTIKQWSAGLDRYKEAFATLNGPIPLLDIERAEMYFNEFFSADEPLELLHGDLHHENILYSSERGWLAIDPKGVLGSRYCDTVSFFINHLHNKENPRDLLKFRVKKIEEALGLDEIKLLKAGVAMSTLYACWALEDHDPEWTAAYQCTKWFTEFLFETTTNKRN